MPEDAIPLHTMRTNTHDDDDDGIDGLDNIDDDVPLIGGSTNNGIGSDARSGADGTNNHKRSMTARLSGMLTSAKPTVRSERCVSSLTASSKPYPFPSNAVSNAKYSPVMFIPIILYEQFKFFFNLYFLLVALSQIVPALRIGYLSSYIVPLGFVLTVTMAKEAWDDIQRRRRDSESNSELYEVLTGNQPSLHQSRSLKVGDLIRIHKDQRIPADMILLSSSEKSGESFIRTDQLDGETDWKLRIACPLTQKLAIESATGVNNGSSGVADGDETINAFKKVVVIAGPPEKSIHSFLGTLKLEGQSIGLSVDNTLWANTVLASGTAIGIVIYTGHDTRQEMNTSVAGSKVGLLELEINNLSKILCVCVFLLSIGLVVIHGFGPDWYVDIMRFLILFSTIIPVSLRVNLDMGKSVYAYQIEHDKAIPDTIVRTSTIPEDLGRIEYLLTDKTGTLTQNDMEMKKVHVGTVSYAGDAMDEVVAFVRDGLSGAPASVSANTASSVPLRSRREIGNRVRDIVTCLAICHSVTPSFEDGNGGQIEYQAASPDEIAIVKWTAAMGLSLYRRDRTSMTLIHEATRTPHDFEILHVFPFNSDNKRMGIIVRDKSQQKSGELWFFQKGADTVMAKIVQHNDWLEEETANMAREGLRTLVIGRKKLTSQLYDKFVEKYNAASLSMFDRDVAMAKVVGEYLEHDLELLGLTGVEDRLQKDMKPSLELLRNAGIKIWMLTGDKVETARCVAVSAKLVSRGQFIYTVTKLDNPDEAYEHLEFLREKPDACLLIDGESLSLYLQKFKSEFVETAVRLPVVIACRCTPQQKADVAILIKEATKKRVCCIGDGGNDVSMIQAADVGVGIVGKEGKQASLAADFSITQFCHLTKLLVWHGRNSYKRSAKLAQFVIHRGLIISICQTVFSIASSFEPLALYQGWLMVGYATIYTMAPVFSLVLDRDVDEDLAKLYPELYKELTAGTSLSYRTFFVWVLVSLYQGCVIQGMSQLFVGSDSEQFTKMVAVSFSALLFNELIMVALEIITWNKVMVFSEIITMCIFVGSVPFLGDYFDLNYVTQVSFYWKTALITATALIPPWIGKTLRRKLKPPNYAKVQQA
ncbi:putative aminophospholipid-translocating P4-type ATPase NEO1 [Sugiyamaella lignohabitans]|uniref:Phospholipid-transporting ATPase n=1 Tax=Sugiyamaella lignohabitans TaxID=796027 RepID=A0A167C9A0_9ASCO|nr:putative aminophospholipid-translocating P4-type ATPase NEO1 [Sugiyamaella lignohabitans]ANB11385.1 putative aminophospholipid-translocating P4-type ATPase NEO1 [Sugiyamaella lignohabitans]